VDGDRLQLRRLVLVAVWMIAACLLGLGTPHAAGAETLALGAPGSSAYRTVPSSAGACDVGFPAGGELQGSVNYGYDSASTRVADDAGVPSGTIREVLATRAVPEGVESFSPSSIRLRT
jgi:hypothetical protein